MKKGRVVMEFMAAFALFDAYQRGRTVAELLALSAMFGVAIYVCNRDRD